MLAGTAAGAAAALSRFPTPAIAQAEPFRLGLLTVKTGPLAQGGIQMEQGVLTYLKETNYMIGGRKVDFFSVDTGGNPAGTKTKAQELVERDKVDVILGPLAAFELYAINDYIREQKMPTLSLAAADDLTQRKPNPYLLRASATSSQAMPITPRPSSSSSASSASSRISPLVTSRWAASRHRFRKRAAALSTSYGRLW
jgi:branched-chain amino acid transport system substrate-binding protein